MGYGPPDFRSSPTQEQQDTIQLGRSWQSHARNFFLNRRKSSAGLRTTGVGMPGLASRPKPRLIAKGKPHGQSQRSFTAAGGYRRMRDASVGGSRTATNDGHRRAGLGP